MSGFDVFIQLRLAGLWVDVTDKVYQRDPITITRGRQDEAGLVDPAVASMTLDNRSGDFSPRNPTGAYYGLLGRNTPVRVMVGTPPLAGFTTATDTATSQDAPSLDSTVDAALLVCAWLSGQHPGTYTLPGSMTDPQTSGTSSTLATGTENIAAEGATGVRTATFTGTVDGHVQASILIPGDDGVPVVEELIDHIETANSTTEAAALFTADDTQDGWWLLAVQAWNTDPLDQMPHTPAGSPGRWAPLFDTGAGGPRVKAWMRRVDVAGAQEVDFPTPVTTGTVDNHCRLFVLSNVRYSSVRVVGEVSAWPPRWDTSGNDVYVPVEVGGILRRLGQGVKPLHSAVYRFVTGQKPTPVGYWPCEDAESSTRCASAVDGQPDLVQLQGAAEFASFSDFVASDPLPVVQDGRFGCDVSGYTTTGSTQLQWLMHVDSGDVGDNQVILRLGSTGSVTRVEVLRTTGETLQVALYRYNPDDETANAGKPVTLGSVTQPFTGVLNDNLLHCKLDLVESGGNIAYTLLVRKSGTDAGTTASGVLTGHTLGTVTRIGVNPGRGLKSVAVGHLLLRSDTSALFDLHTVIDAWAGEAAGRRIERLCAEENVGFTGIGPLDATTSMGPQRSSTLVDLLAECSDADGGLLYETRDDLGLSYRTRWTMYNQGKPIPPAPSDGAVQLPPGDTGGVGDTPPPSDGGTQTKTYTANFARSWDSDGGMRSGSGAVLYQGQNSGNVGGHGNQKSWVWFDWATIWADLAGKTVSKAELYLYADHWWFDAGGTAVLGYHTSDHRDSYDGGQDNVDEKRSSGWPKPGGRWVDITGTTIANAFAAGTAKGITIGPGPSTSLTYYGYFEPPLDGGDTNTRAPKLRFTYS